VFWVAAGLFTGDGALIRRITETPHPGTQEMTISQMLVAAAVLASTPAMAMEVRVGNVPVSELESHGWTRVDAHTLRFETPTGRTYTLTEGDGPLRARAEELMKNASNLSTGESEELAFLTEALSAATMTPSPTANVCNGVLNFNPQFFYGMTDGSVQVTMSFIDYAPYYSLSKRMFVVATASAPASEGLPVRTVTGDSDWFQSQPTMTVTAFAGIDPTFHPQLTATGYFYGTGSRSCPNLTFQQNG
jgi:hypothetical protein